MNLVRAELRRLYRRRVTRWMFAVVLVILAGIGATTWFGNQQLSPAVVAEAEAEAQRQYENQLRVHREMVRTEIAECEAAPPGDPRWPAGFDCQELAAAEPRREDFRAEWYLPSTFSFAEQFPEMIQGFAGLLALFGFAVGASYVGAEWRTGGMMNLLLWRPRRWQVFWAKLGTLLGTLTGVGALLGAVWTGFFWLLAHQRGVTETTTGAVWQSLGLTGLRGLALVLVAAAVGFALASLGRHTAAAMGTAVTAVVVGVPGVLVAVQAAGLRFTEAWLWPIWVVAWLDGSYVVRDFQMTSCDAIGPGSTCDQPAKLELTWQMAGLGMAGLVILLVGAAMWQMRRRDVA